MKIIIVLAIIALVTNFVYYNYQEQKINELIVIQECI